MIRRKGFTLTEILVVVVIVGILAALAIPRYIKSVETGRKEEAKVNLQLVLTGQRLYRLDHGHYASAGGINIMSGGAVCTVCGKRHYYIDDPNALAGRYFTYAITAGAAKTFTAQATRKAPAPPGYKGKWVKINEAGTISDNY